MSDTLARRSGLTHRQIIAWRNGEFVVFAMCGVGLASWMARTPAIKEALGISTAEMGVLIFGLAAGSIFGLMVSSHLIARFGARHVMVACMVAIPVGFAIAGFGVTAHAAFWIVIVGLAIFGFSMGLCDVAMNLSGAVNERVLGRTIMPVFHAFFSFGTMVGAGIGALAELAHVPLSLQTAVIGALTLAAGVWGALATQSENVLRESDGGAGDAAVDGWRSRLAVWKDPRTLLIGLIVLGMAFAEGSANDWLALASVEGHGADKPTGAIVFGIFVTAMTVGRLTGPRLLDRYGRVPVLRASAALAGFGLLVFIFVPVLWIAVVGVILWGLGSALGFPTGMSAAADDPRTAAARVSAVAMIGYCAFLVGPPAIGFLGQHFGLLHALLLVLILIVVAGVASGAARDPSKV
ncbi:MAG TPA: MFS transporter [Terrimesophilobacter sp.]|nr:MFS transporter [Terrimesophilobacter sp.]